MQTIIVVFHVFLTLSLIGLILIQHGKGADAGAAFGSGASSTVFGARGSGSFLTRSTAVLAALFFITSMTMGYFATQTGKQPGLMSGMEEQELSVAVDSVEPMDVPEVPPAPVSELPTPGNDQQVVAPSGKRLPEVPIPAELPQPADGAAPEPSL